QRQLARVTYLEVSGSSPFAATLYVQHSASSPSPTKSTDNRIQFRQRRTSVNRASAPMGFRRNPTQPCDAAHSGVRMVPVAMITGTGKRNRFKKFQPSKT